MRGTTVGDVINHWPGDEESHASFSKLRAKFKVPFNCVGVSVRNG